jgi:hypothetical protein
MLIVRIRSRLIAEPMNDSEDPIFHTVLLARRPGTVPLLLSLAAHGVGVLLFLILAPHLFFYDRDTVDLSRFRVEPLRLTLTEPIFLPPPERSRTSKLRQPSSGESQEREPVKANGSPSAQTRATALAERIELPKPRRKLIEAPIIVQPDFDPRALPPIPATPPMAFWARQAPDLPNPLQSQKEIKPGRTEAPSPPAKPVAIPSPAIPNREQVVSDVNIAMPPRQTPETTALPAPNSATVPVNARELTLARTASFETFAGQPVNVMALAADRKDTRQVEIPRGFQNIPAPTAGSQASPSAAPGGAAAETTKTGPNASGTSTAVAGAAPGARERSDSSRSVPAGPTAGDRTSAQLASPPRQQPTAATAPSKSSGQIPLAASPKVESRVLGTAAAADVTRITHPEGGNFDVVIMQSAARDDLPDLGGLLSGAPVYTVFLRVGDRREWLLEYCVPGRESVQSNPYEITLEEVGSITPPYPISTVIPNGLVLQQNPKHIVLHGLLTAAGDLRISRTPESANPFLLQLTALLSEWRFRPAFKNKKAIEVEVLLVIPPRG